MTDKSRRTVLIGASVVAASVATSASTRGVFAQRTDSDTASTTSAEWDFGTAKELAAALRARKISAVELADHTIARIEMMDRRVNAVVVRDFGRARDAAASADAALARGDERALLGVPMTVKESFNVAGLPTT